MCTAAHLRIVLTHDMIEATDSVHCSHFLYCICSRNASQQKFGSKAHPWLHSTAKDFPRSLDVWEYKNTGLRDCVKKTDSKITINFFEVRRKFGFMWRNPSKIPSIQTAQGTAAAGGDQKGTAAAFVSAFFPAATLEEKRVVLLKCHKESFQTTVHTFPDKNDSQVDDVITYGHHEPAYDDGVTPEYIYWACSAERKQWSDDRHLIRLAKAFNGVYEGGGSLSTDVILARCATVLTPNDFDPLMNLYANSAEKCDGNCRLRHEIADSPHTLSSIGYLHTLCSAFPSLRYDASTFDTRGSEYMTCWTAVVLLLLTTQLTKQQGGQDEDAHPDAFLEKHCTRMVAAPTLQDNRYTALRDNLWCTGRFWHWMQRLIPIENHLKVYLLVASCLEGAGKYHQRSGSHVPVSYLSYRYLLEMLRENYELDGVGVCAADMRKIFHFQADTANH